MRVAKKNVYPGSKNILEKGVIESLESGTIISLNDFTKVVEIANNNDISKGEARHHYYGAPLHEWL